MGPTKYLVKVKLTWVKDVGLSLSLHEDYPTNILKISYRTKVYYVLFVVSYVILSHYCNFLMTLPMNKFTSIVIPTIILSSSKCQLLKQSLTNYAS